MAGERPCSVEGCPRTLSALVPEKITECSHHQYLRLGGGRFIDDLARENELSLEDKGFLLSHAFYVDDTLYCYVSDLRRYLGIPRSTFYGYPRKRIHAERKKVGKYHRYLLAAEETARIMNLVRHWISTSQAAYHAGVRYETLQIYAQEGYFGPVCEYLDGVLAIRRECLLTLGKRYAAVRMERQKRGNRSGRHLRKGEVGVATIAFRLKVSTNTVCTLIRTRRLKGIKRKGRYAVKEKDFQAFCYPTS